MYRDVVSDLTNISLSIKRLWIRFGEKFVFIDSVTTMLIYNTSEIFASFMHGWITKLRIKGFLGFLISAEKETEENVRSQIVDLCDNAIKI